MQVPTSAAPSTHQPAANPAELSPHETSPRDRGVTFRVVVLCLALAVVLGYIIPIIDYKIFNTFLGGMHLPPGAIGALLVLVLIVNPLLRLVSKKLAFSRNESLTVYITCLFSSLIPGHGAENFIIPNLIAPFYFAKPENKWLDWLQPHLKPWLTPALNGNGGEYNRAVVEPWYVGLGAGESIPWGAWMVPLFVWGTFVLVTYAMLACLSVMLRAQWSDHEALSFPLLRLPLEMTEDLDRDDKYAVLGRFFRNPMMWSGFAIAVFIQAMRGLNVYFPDVPTVPLEIPTGPLFSAPPWNQIGWIPVQAFPIAIGITYLLTTEISFSLWFFVWFIKFQLIGAYYMGFVPAALPNAAGAFPGKVFTGFQMGGAYVMYVALVLWTGREHFKHIARRAFGRVAARPKERDEILSYPVAFWGFVIALALMIGFSIVIGVRPDIAVALWICYLVLAIGLTRVAVEGGMLSLLHDSLPLGGIAKLLNSGSSSWLTIEGGLVPASLLQAGIVYHMRAFAMPSFLQGFKLAHDRKISPKPLGALIAAVVVISTVMSFWMTVRLGYENGGLSFGHKWWTQVGSLQTTNFINNTINNVGGSPLVSWISAGIGAGFTYLMMLARSRFSGFPLHPIGYLMCHGFSGYTFWFSIFLGWLCKVLIMRFGGHESYRKAIPLFLGLALGDVAMMLFWLGIDGWQGRVAHQLLPG